jgi:RNase P subunit RPR2
MLKISIARALIELKTLEKRIEKKLNEIEPVTILTGNTLESGITSKEAFEKSVKASYQSLIGLIEHKRKLKAAIVKSNAVTVVEVAGEKMTVAEAIERKSSIEIEKNIKRTLSKKYTEKLKTVENHNDTI